MAKLSWQQAEFLILIDDHCSPDGRFWVPPSGYKRSYSETLGRDVYVDGAGVAASLKALQRRGLIEFKPSVSPYASKITEAGRVLIEQWREMGEWPVEVKE